MKNLTLEGTLRTEMGRAKTKELRAKGFVPCNLYGGKDNINFYAPYNAFLKLVYNPDFFKVSVTVDGVTRETLIKEIQFNAVNDRVQHIDFLELVPGKKVNAEVPLKLVGKSEGVKAGGKMVQKMRKLKVKATPENLVELIEVNVENLLVGKSIYVRDIQKENPNLEIVNSPEIPVATVDVTRSLKSAEADAAKAGTAAKGTPAKAATPAKTAEAKPAAKK